MDCSELTAEDDVDAFIIELSVVFLEVAVLGLYYFGEVLVHNMLVFNEVFFVKALSDF